MDPMKLREDFLHDIYTTFLICPFVTSSECDEAFHEESMDGRKVIENLGIGTAKMAFFPGRNIKLGGRHFLRWEYQKNKGPTANFLKSLDTIKATL